MVVPVGAGNRSFVTVICRILPPCPGFDLRLGQFTVCVEVTAAWPSLTSIFRANDTLLVLSCCRWLVQMRNAVRRLGGGVEWECGFD